MPQANNDENLLITGQMMVSDEVQAAAGDGKPSKTVATSMSLYNGGVLRQWFGRVVLDIAGMRLREPQVKILNSHGHALGFATEINTNDGQVKLEGQLVRDEADPIAMQVINKASAGMIWEASIGARMLRVEMLEDGEKATVNGQEVTGPLRIARESEVLEGSIVAFGEDQQGTSVSIAASRQNQNNTEAVMSTEKNTTGGETQGAAPQTVTAAATPATAAPATQTPAEPAATTQDSVLAAANLINEQNVAAAANLTRISAINAIDGDAEIKAQAINEGWSADKAELTILRASRQAPAIGTSRTANLTPEIIEASARMFNSGERMDTIEAGYSEQVLEGANRLRTRGLKGMIEAHLHANGMPCPGYNASTQDWVRAAFFSGNTVSTLVSNIANKVALAQFNLRPSALTQIYKRTSVNDFKTKTSVRLVGTDRQMEDIAPGGEIKSGKFGEDTSTIKAKTVGKLFGITREMMVNDDLGEFMRISALLGEAAFLARENQGWTHFLSNPATSDGTAFFHANHNNVVTSQGVDSAGYAAAVKVMNEQTDNSDNTAFVMATPDRVLVSPAQSQAAQEMFVSNNIVVAGDTDLVKASANVNRGLYRPVMAPNIGAAGGGSDSVYYMFSEFGEAFLIAYLNNRDTPFIESAGMSPQFLGECMRGYYDYGFGVVDYQFGVRVTG